MNQYPLVLALLLLCLNQSRAQELKAYQIYNSQGEATSFEKMAQKLSQAEVVLFGELHNNPIAHWLQYELSLNLMRRHPVSFGAEMFEADNQSALNLYLQDSIDQKALDTLARLWPNYKTDYKPLLDLARDSSCPFIATNIPRSMARLVFQKGFESLDSLSQQQKAWVAPMPIAYDPELPGYRKMLDMGHGHGGDNLPKAQAIKDATMAHFIYTSRRDEGLFLHFNGDYHSANYEGIYWYLKQLDPGMEIMTIATVLQNEVDDIPEKDLNRADFILVVDEQVTTSY